MVRPLLVAAALLVSAGPVLAQSGQCAQYKSQFQSGILAAEGALAARNVNQMRAALAQMNRSYTGIQYTCSDADVQMTGAEYQMMLNRANQAVW